MKYKIILILIIAVLFSQSVFSVSAKTKVLFVKSKIENIKDTQAGKPIANVLQKTKLNVIEQKGDWVKVSLTGWIKKDALTSDLSSIKDESHKELISAGNGFYYKNVSFKSGSIGNEVVGEIINKSGKSYTIANFVLSVYGAEGKLLETAVIMISNIAVGVTKSFQTFLTDTDPENISTYKIQFENGL